ncbi:hypothetical protein [Corynebacterium argentoratense]|uniref:hypothetical protein n=1 Tax=Corynebacterium argentoratense TaxID=42817 RepID=UPI00404367CA
MWLIVLWPLAGWLLEVFLMARIPENHPWFGGATPEGYFPIDWWKTSWQWWQPEMFSRKLDPDTRKRAVEALKNTDPV